jgi:hypothetical protein
MVRSDSRCKTNEATARIRQNSPAAEHVVFLFRSGPRALFTIASLQIQSW